eukprot:8875438-Pyramimonas_sp.AAC.2
MVRLALAAFEEMPSSGTSPRDLYTFNSLITVCARAGEGAKARDAYALMQQEDPPIQPDTVTINALLSTCKYEVSTPRTPRKLLKPKTKTL